MKLYKLMIVFIVFSLILGVAAVPGVFAAPSDAKIDSVEVTQVMGKGIDMDSGKYYYMNMFVAEKPTAIQVVMTEAVSSGSAKLDIYYEDSLLTTVTPEESGEHQIFTFIPDKSAVNSWKAGRYKFTATVGGSTKSTEAVFNESRSFSILLISAEAVYDGITYEAPELKADTIPTRAQPLPVSESKYIRKYRNAKIAFGTGSVGYDLSTPEGQMSILSDIEKYRAVSASKYDVVVCVVSAPLTAKSKAGGGTTAGYTNCRSAVVLTLYGNPSAEERDATLIHELGHIFGNGDEYTGGEFSLKINGAPYGISGTTDGKSVKGDKIYFKSVSGNDYSGIVIEDVQNPYNPKTAAPMYGRTSYMGSSFTHWTTSMMWEQTYRYFIPNYSNVLPRVYTDGSIVAKHKMTNSLTDEDINKMKQEYREMLNEVRAAQGYVPYKEDEILRSGDKRLQQLAEEALEKGNFDLINIQPMINEITADTNHMFEQASVETYLREAASGYTEDMRLFFMESPCGKSWISDDYMLLSFVKSGDVVYTMWSTLSKAYEVESEEEKLTPQPEEAPIPEINPVTDEIIDAERYENGEYEKPAVIDETDRTEPETAKPEPETVKPEPVVKPGESATTPAYSDLSKSQRISMLNYDVFDLGYLEAMGVSESYPYPIDYIYGFYAWYANDQYGLSITAEDAKAAIDKVSADGKADWDGVGQACETESARFDLICVMYELYPPQELREESYMVYVLDPQWRYGKNPARARSDKDSIDSEYGKAYNDADVGDPDGGW